MTNEPFRGLNLSAALSVKDLERSLTWYHDVFGFAVSQKYEREGKPMAVSLAAGDVAILITQDDGAKGWDRAKGEGFSLQITTEQDINALADAIKQRGGKLDLEPSDTPWGPRIFRLSDPDGFKFTISSPRKPAQ